MAHAVEEVDYKPPRFAFDLQIMVLPDRGMILTFTEKTPEDIKNSANLIGYLREMRRILKEKLGLDGSTIADLLAQAMVTAAQGAAGEASPEQKQEDASKAQTESEKPRFAIFRFASMRSLCAYAGMLPRNLRVASRLYREGDTYYLYLERGGASYERYSRASIQALEFGELYAAGEDKLAYLEEHGECLISQKALARLRL